MRTSFCHTSTTWSSPWTRRWRSRQRKAILATSVQSGGSTSLAHRAAGSDSSSVGFVRSSAELFAGCAGLPPVWCRSWRGVRNHADRQLTCGTSWEACCPGLPGTEWPLHRVPFSLSLPESLPRLAGRHDLRGGRVLFSFVTWTPRTHASLLVRHSTPGRIFALPGLASHDYAVMGNRYQPYAGTLKDYRRNKSREFRPSLRC